MRKKLYFMHPVNTYGTELELELLGTIRRYFNGWTVENPNQKKHQEGYENFKRETGNGMKYFTEMVLPECGMGVYLAFRDGTIPAGVAKEAEYFLDRGRPLWEIIPSFDPVPRREIPADKVLSVQDTRARIRDGEGNTLPY